MALTGDQLAIGLTQYNYLPRISAGGGAFPPCFSSESLSVNTAREVGRAFPPRRAGYDAVRVRETRFDLAWREMSIPHPVPYVNLVGALVEHANLWVPRIGSRNSRIRPRRHPDGRIFSMDRGVTSARPPLTARVLLRTDITRFYSSLYTHAIPWALVGREVAKSQRNDRGAWFNRLDAAFRLAQRGETVGVGVGTGAAAIAGEMVLSSIDRELGSFRFARYIDDYYYYGRSQRAAEQFLTALSDLLVTYRLEVNPRKTAIIPLPIVSEPRWRRDIRRLSAGGRKTERAVMDLLDSALELTAEQPESSALKYALRVVEASTVGADPMTREAIAESLGHLAFHRPVATPFFCRLVLGGRRLTRLQAGALDALIEEHSRRRLSDSVSWSLYCQARFGLSPSQASLTSVIEFADNMAMSLLVAQGAGRVDREVAARIDEFGGVEYDRDRFWLARYQLARNAPDLVDGDDAAAFAMMRNDGVNFVDVRRRPRRSRPGRPTSGPYAE